jgi:hypothetical protein
MGGWIEGLVFAVCALGWGVVELVALRLDAPPREPDEGDSASARGAASGMPAALESGATKTAATTDSRESP